MRKLDKAFYLRPALDSVTDFLGKGLVHNTPQGRISGIVYEVEAYPAFSDQVHHGNKKTPRTEVMWQEGGYAYVYVIYGVWYQFAVVVNKKNIPDVVFIRGAIPLEGKNIMKRQWNETSPPMEGRSFLGRFGFFLASFIPAYRKAGYSEARNKDMQEEELSNSPGKLCKSFLITKEQYGVDLTGDELFFEDWDVKIPNEAIQTGKRVGISSIHEGFDKPLRYFIKPSLISIPNLLVF